MTDTMENNNLPEEKPKKEKQPMTWKRLWKEWILPFGLEILALLLIVIGWVIFASDDVSVLLPYLGSMFGANGAIGGMDVYTLLTKAVLIIICCIASTELPKRLFVTAAGKMNEKAAFAVKSVLTLALLALSFVFLIGDSYNPFLYFRF